MPTKKYFIFCFCIFISSASFAQFGNVNHIDTINPGSVTKTATGDFNNDGFKDVVVINNEWPYDKVKIYYNNGGNNFSAANIIVPLDSFQVLHNLAVADIDTDGWEDILISQEFPNRLILLKNNSGTFTSQLFAQAVDFPSRLIVHDFDNNGASDVLSLQHLQVLIYKQNSLGFDTGTIIHSGTEFYDIEINDFNNDGFTDVVVASIGFEILLNDGNANFTIQSDTGNGITLTVRTGVVDNDGDADVLTWEALQGILFYANDGAGNFSFQDTVLQHSDNFKSFVIHDFDHDNDPDVYTSIGQQGNLIWMQNNGTGSFTPPLLIHSEPGQLIYEVHADDLNNDSRKEIIWADKKLAYHLNNFPLDINEISGNKNFVIYPNPARGAVYLKNSFDEEVIVHLSDPSGRITEKTIVNAGATLELKDLSSGIYFIEARSGDGTPVFKEKIIFIE